jgi:hypothetical protein
MEKKTRKKKVLNVELENKAEAAPVVVEVEVKLNDSEQYTVIGTGKSAAFGAKKQFMCYGFTATRLIKQGFVTLKK